MVVDCSINAKTDGKRWRPELGKTDVPDFSREISATLAAPRGRALSAEGRILISSPFSQELSSFSFSAAPLVQHSLHVLFHLSGLHHVPWIVFYLYYAFYNLIFSTFKRNCTQKTLLQPSRNTHIAQKSELSKKNNNIQMIQGWAVAFISLKLQFI